MKQIDKIIFTLIMFFVSFSEVMAQDYYDTICWVRVNDPQYYATDGVMHSQKAELNSLFAKNGVQYYEKAYPFAKTPELLKIHEIRCETGKDISKLIQSLQENFNIVFDNFLRIEIPDEDVMVYDPVDWMWYAHSNDWLWHLKKIQADLAWDITTGDTAVKTAVIDYAIDVNHPDLASEIYPPYDPYTGNTLPTNYNHGSAVASFVSAETAKQGEVPLGQLASVGFETKLIAYETASTPVFLQKALHSSTVMGADVIVSCGGGSLSHTPSPATGEELVMKEILNNGTVIVMPAGNGSTGTHNSNANGYTEFYPFNSSYDERVIVVTSTDTADCHRFIVNGEDKTHSHFPTVDICAPGYGVFGAQHSQYSGNPNFPYYGNLTGTSFAAPIVAGACALLKSINKDFTPGEIQYFIKSTADPVQDEHDYHGMLGAGRLNIYRAVQKANDCSPIIISSNEIWNEDRIEVCGIEVIDGGCLTIKSSLKLSKHCSFIVHSGGKLIIDGGYLTSLDDEFWPGIEVWGNSTAHQYPVNGHYAQGYVELKNGAVIENAECALALWHPDHWSTTGGIVHADNATFRNCAMAVHALHYTNHNYVNGKETAYNSRFQNCSFTVDNGYLGTTTFFKHIDLDNVNGISFTGCDFSADRSVDGVSPYCIGLAAYQSGFAATAYCDHGNGNSAVMPCPEENLKGCSFTGFYHGIHASNNGTNTNSFTVHNASFRDNTCGLYALNTGFATILSNDFALGSDPDCSYGILADHVTGFCIEENAFRPMRPDAGQTYGIAIRDSRDGNDIYRNHFDGLTCGNLASGINATGTSNLQARRRNSGLTYSCNDNSNNQVDFCVLDDGPFSGIQQQQGSATLPAGNTFSGSQWHFHNGGGHVIDYHYSSNASGQQPVESLLHRVTPLATAEDNPCLPHYSNPGPQRSAAQKAETEDRFLAAKAAHDGLCRILDNRIDGGSTAAQTADINTAAPSDLWRLRARLLNHSPYLSQKTLTTAADRHDLFPESVLFEILAANPDELKKDTLIRYMEQKERPLPTYMTDLLRQMASGTTARTALLAQMNHYARERDLAAGDIVRSNLNDTLADHDELRTWLGNMESLAADRIAVASFVQQRDFASALALAESLPELYGLQGSELNDHNDYMSLLSLYQTLDGEGRNAQQLTEAETAMVEGIANDGQGASRAMAEALLQSLSDESVTATLCPEMPEANGGRGRAATPDPALLNKALGFSASLNPNPATTWAAMDYTLPAGATKATLTLTNALGVAVMTVELDGSQGQKVLDLRPLADGVYSYAVRCGEYVMNGKIVITK